MSYNSSLQPFQVKRMGKLNFIIIVLLFCIGLGFIIYFSIEENVKLGLLIGSFFFILVIFRFLKKNKNDELFIEVDKSGIWMKNKEVTNWKNYIRSYVAYIYRGKLVDYHSLSLEEKNLKDLHQIINIEHYKDGENGYFIHRIFFSGTEDKTLDEVMLAIENFYEADKKTVGNFKKLR